MSSQNTMAGYKTATNMYSQKYVDYLDEKRIESAFYNPKSKPKTCQGIVIDCEGLKVICKD